MIYGLVLYIPWDISSIWLCVCVYVWLSLLRTQIDLAIRIYVRLVCEYVNYNNKKYNIELLPA